VFPRGTFLYLKAILNKNNPVIYAQGGLTSGKVGLLQYHTFLFSLNKVIQPLAIQASDGPFVS